jgi:adenosylhomocysteine nucleosidase
MIIPIRRLGLISALHHEQAGLIEQMQYAETTMHGMRQYVSGRLWGIECVCVLSRIGKVAAAATAAMLIEKFGVTHILFTGVAGSGDPEVRIGDIVLAQQLVQHDVDASPLFPRFQIPLTETTVFLSDKALCDLVGNAANAFLEHDFSKAISSADKEEFRLKQPQIHQGLVASGDQFIHSHVQMSELKSALPGLLAVEMEGAAVAQICHEFGVPFMVIRTISDAANEAAPVDFNRFINRIAAKYAFGIVKQLSKCLLHCPGTGEIG